MKPARQPDHTPRWPLALLLLAWLGASCPVNIVGMTVAWIGEAHSFSHQKRLTLDVARLLVGKITRELGGAGAIAARARQIRAPG